MKLLISRSLDKSKENCNIKIDKMKKYDIIAHKIYQIKIRERPDNVPNF